MTKFFNNIFVNLNFLIFYEEGMMCWDDKEYIKDEIYQFFRKATIKIKYQKFKL
jgi:hypothetical protein